MSQIMGLKESTLRVTLNYAFVSKVCHRNLRFVLYKIEMAKDEEF